MKLVLYNYWRSSAAYRVRIVLALKGLSYETVPIDLLAGEQSTPRHRALSPQGLVPVLVVDGVPLTQSIAIIDYLDTIVPIPRMVPEDPLEAALVRSRALVVAADIHPIANLRILRRLSDMGHNRDARDEWYRHWVVEGLTALEAASGNDRFLSGAEPGLADACLVPQMYNARRLDTPLAAFPRLLAIDADLNRHPAIAASHPDRCRP